ncbi:MAG: 1-deoxy-D-xylulose-5-phosphate synthase [Eubacteriales bacterium]
MSEKLDAMKNPSEISGYTHKEMCDLADELRKEIITSVSQNGGHLSSNLGVIELTIALMASFNFDHEDQIVWDVGHQSYAYKLLTGRRDRFSTLRKLDGISGFPRRSESPYDFFDTGHSSTSISAALGLLRAKRLKGEKGRVIAVIGDGALTGGLAYEALNDAGQFGENLIVILNDNQMSIDHNVGALSRHLASIRSSSGYIRTKRRTEIILKRIPFIGKHLVRFLSFLKDSLRLAIRRNHPVIFEDLGFRYYGPVDGHNIPNILRYLSTIKELKEPVLLHVCTQKGRGYDYAEAQPSQYHGVAPFDVELGCEDGSCTTFTTVFGKTLIEIARDDRKVVAVCAAMGTSIGLEPFHVLYKDRFFDVGIAEGHALTMAAGLAVNGMVPVVALYSTFLQRGFDQVLHDICLQKLHVVLAIDRAGIVGADGETHQGLYDIPMLLTMPGIEMFAPRDYAELAFMLRYAVEEAKGPVAIRYPRASESEEFHIFDQISIEKAQYLNIGAHISLLSAGFLAGEVYEASRILEREGIFADVIDLRRIKPLDEATILESAVKTGIVVCCEDGMYNNGISSRISQLLAAKCVSVKFSSVGVNDRPVPAGTRTELLKREGMDAQSIANLCRQILASNK